LSDLLELSEKEFKEMLQISLNSHKKSKTKILLSSTSTNTLAMTF